MDDLNRISVTVCGNGGCGKSSITLRLVRIQWIDEYDPTIEDSYSVTRTIDGQTYFLMLTDTAGQEEYRGLWAASNMRCDAFLLVYDITVASSLPALEHFNDMIEMETERRLDAGAVPPVKIVVGNKCDLQARREIKSQQGLEWARKHGCGFMETSAKEMVNIEETLALMVRRIMEARQHHAAGTGGHYISRTATATPALVSEKAAAVRNPSRQAFTGSEGADASASVWSKLRCW